MAVWADASQPAQQDIAAGLHQPFTLHHSRYGCVHAGVTDPGGAALPIPGAGPAVVAVPHLGWILGSDFERLGVGSCV